MRTEVFLPAVFSLALFASSGLAQEAVESAQAAFEAGDVGRGMRILRQAGEQGDAQALFRLGELYRDGQIVARSDARALEAMRTAAELGMPAAQNALGALLLAQSGEGAITEALPWLERAAQSGQAQYQFQAGSAIETFQPERLADAVVWYRLAADQDFPPAWTSLGVLALEGRGQVRDPSAAYEYFEQAAAVGDARAANNLGLMLSRGEDVERDYESAAIYFAAAAERDLPAGLRNLSVMYANGFGVPLDEGLADELLARARQLETPSLSAVLADIGFPFDVWLHEPDWATPLDAREEQAALAGDPVALYRTAFRYLYGAGVGVDVQLALARFEAAANAGLGSAALSLGLLYANGVVVPQSYRQSYYWLSVAGRYGVLSAASLRDLIAERMTRNALAAVQRELELRLESD